MANRIRLIDGDIGRRRRVLHELNRRGFPVETLDELADFTSDENGGGLLFVSDEPTRGLAAELEGARGSAPYMVPVVGYAESPVPEKVVAAMRAGAVDYLKWPFDSHLLDAVLERMAKDNDRLLKQELVRLQARAAVQRLSGRETDVLSHLLMGLSNKEIGRVLGISYRTIELHRANMMSKLGAQSPSDAVRIGIYAGLDQGPAVFKFSAVA